MVISGHKDLFINGRKYPIKNDFDLKLTNVKKEEMTNVSGRSINKLTGNKGGSISGAEIFVKEPLEEFSKLVEGVIPTVEVIWYRQGRNRKYTLKNAEFLDEQTFKTEDSTISVSFVSDERMLEENV